MVDVSQVIQGISIIVGLASLVGGVSIQQISHPIETYQDKVGKVQQERWNKLCNELADVVVNDVMDTIQEDSTDHKREDLNEQAKASFLFRQSLDLKKLNGVEDALEKVREPENVYQACRRAWKRALYACWLAVILSIPAVALSFSYGLHQYLIYVAALFFTASALLIIYVIYQCYVWLQKRDKLDEMCDEIEFM